MPSIEGLQDISFLTNETIFSLEALPKSMIVLGAGPIGVEMAAALNRLGVEVTILKRSSSFLKKDDPELVGRFIEILRDEGVTIRLEMQTHRFEQRDGKIIAHIDARGGAGTVEADSVLVALGRVPNLSGLDLEQAGVEYDSTGLKVDKHLRTTALNIYAAGDVVPPYLFTHIAEYEAVIATTNACFGLPVKTANYDNILWATYTDPELAHAGLTEDEARIRYGDSIRIYRWEHKNVDRAKTDLADKGLSKFICDRKGRLLGIHILGHGAAELMHEAQLAKSLGIPFSLLNYAFGLTKIPFWQYALGSWIGMLPGTVMYVYFGASLRSLAELSTGQVETGKAGQAFFLAGLVATVVVTIFVTRVARKALKQAAPRPDQTRSEAIHSLA